MRFSYEHTVALSDAALDKIVYRHYNVWTDRHVYSTTETFLAWASEELQGKLSRPYRKFLPGHDPESQNFAILDMCKIDFELQDDAILFSLKWL